MKFFLFLVVTVSSVCAFDISSFVDQIKPYEISRDHRGLYLNLCAAMEEMIDESSPEQINNAKKLIDDFYHTAYVSNFIGYSWEVYPAFLRVYSALQEHPIQPDLEFDQKGYKQGIISAHNLSSLLSLIESAKIIPISASMTHPTYHSHLGFEPLEEYYNTHHKFLDLTKLNLEPLKNVLLELRDPIAACMKSPWKVVNVRCWKSHPREKQYDEGGGWHYDGFPYDAKKIMIYLTGCSSDLGTTQLEPNYFCVEGPPGTWFFFENSKISHRVLYPKLRKNAHDRLIVEVTIIPSFEFQLEPVFPGLLAMWPYSPWGGL